MEYNFTADFEKELDKVFTGDTQWTQTIDKYYKSKLFLEEAFLVHNLPHQ